MRRHVRVLILTQHYDPEPIPKPGELARALSARGHDVTVIAGFPNYPEGKLYPGFRLRPSRRSIEHGVRVIRTWVYPYHGRSAVLRLANYASFMLSAVYGALRAPAADVMYVLHPPITIAVPAWIISVLKRVPFVYDVQDIWPESVLATGMFESGTAFRVMDRIGRWIYRRSSRVLAITEPARRRLIEKGAPPEKVDVPLLWVTETALRQADGSRDIRREFGLQGKFVAMFAGNLGVVQRLDVLVEAAALLADVPRFVLVFVGDGLERPRLESLVSEKQLSNVRFLGRQPFAAMADFQAAADVLIVHLKRTPISDFLVPAKVLSYLGAGRPLLVAMHGPAADLVGRIGAGAVVEPEDPAALAEAARQLSALPEEDLQRMGHNGIEFLRDHNSPTQVFDQYEQMLAAVSGHG